MVFVRAYRTGKEVNKNVLNNKIKVLALGESNNANKFLRTLLTQSPSINNSCVVLYITSQSFVSQVYQKLVVHHPYYYKKQQNSKSHLIDKLLYHLYQIKDFFCNKCYLKRLDSSLIIGPLKHYKVKGAPNCHIYLMSRTLVYRGLIDITQYIEQMKRDRQKYYPVLKNQMNQEAVALSIEQERLIKDIYDHSEQLNEIIQAFQLVIKTLVIRFYSRSKFFKIKQVTPYLEYLRQEVPYDHGSYQIDRLIEQKRTEDILQKEKEEKQRANYQKAHKGLEKGYMPLKNNTLNAHYQS